MIDYRDEMQYEYREKSIFIEIAIVLFAVNVYLPVYQYYIPQSLRYGILLLSFFCFLVGLCQLYDARTTLTQIIVMIIALIVMDCMIYYAEYRTSTTLVNKSIWLFEFWYSLLLSIVAIKTSTLRKRKIRIIIVALLLFTATTTIVGNNIFPYASRVLATSGGQHNMEYFKYNIGGFGIIYSLAVLIPILIFKIRIKDNTRLIYVPIILVLFYSILQSQYTIAILIMFVSSALVLITNSEYYREYKPWFWIVLVVAIVMLFMLHSVVAELILKIYTSMSPNLETTRDRVYSFYELFANGNISGGTDASLRVEHYIESFQAMIHYPIIGLWFVNDPKFPVGMHSDVLDVIAGTGIWGVMTLGFSFRYWFRTAQDYIGINTYYALRIAFITLFLLAIINPVLSSIQLSFTCFVVPIFLCDD